ncbi:hypothetical protein EYF80_049060 [Liparis tanakae]|uniref:Uncharacterized protein n=1 Tax=Liparis tanakae TaxID=230148 RepID=A0A4Z2FHR7_9TELE|nr:hypothetical protein EYF80_049060 [Liparis tanakae]
MGNEDRGQGLRPTGGACSHETVVWGPLFECAAWCVEYDTSGIDLYEGEREAEPRQQVLGGRRGLSHGRGGSDTPRGTESLRRGPPELQVKQRRCSQYERGDRRATTDERDAGSAESACCSALSTAEPLFFHSGWRAGGAHRPGRQFLASGSLRETKKQQDGRIPRISDEVEPLLAPSHPSFPLPSLPKISLESNIETEGWETELKIKILDATCYVYFSLMGVVTSAQRVILMRSALVA